MSNLAEAPDTARLSTPTAPEFFKNQLLNLPNLLHLHAWRSARTRSTTLKNEDFYLAKKRNTIYWSEFSTNFMHAPLCHFSALKHFYSNPWLAAPTSTIHARGTFRTNSCQPENTATILNKTRIKAKILLNLF